MLLVISEILLFADLSAIALQTHWITNILIYIFYIVRKTKADNTIVSDMGSRFTMDDILDPSLEFGRNEGLAKGTA